MYNIKKWDKQWSLTAYPSSVDWVMIAATRPVGLMKDKKNIFEVIIISKFSVL